MLEKHVYKKIGIVFLLLAVIACSQSDPLYSGISWITCENMQLQALNARCGKFSVPLDSSAIVSKKTLALYFALLKSKNTETNAAPFVLLAGGPGQSAVEASKLMLPLLNNLRKEHDILLLDQRGTGNSGILKCAKTMTLEKVFSEENDTQILSQCRQKYQIDARHYLTIEAVKDLEQLRQALQYQQFNLYGISYGTRVGLLYLQKYPESIRTLILDGVAPLEIRLPLYMAKDAQAAWEKLYHDCQKDRACHNTFPDLKAHLLSLLQRLKETPESVQVKHPRSAEIKTLRIHYKGILNLIRAALYTREMSRLLPLAIEQAYQGDYSIFTAIAENNIAATQNMSTGLYLSVICNEDFAQIKPAEVAEHTENTLFGSILYDALNSSCRDWPKTSLPPVYQQRALRDHPVLLLSGEYDPASPAYWAEVAKQHLSQAVHLKVPGVAHGTWHYGCVAELMEIFIQDKGLHNVSTQCLQRLQRPAFFTSANGMQ